MRLGRILLATFAALFAPPVAAQGGAGDDSVRARITGVVYDSVGKRAIAGAIVQLVRADDPSRSHTTTAGTTGAFAFDSVGAGTWVAGFFADALDRLALQSPLTRVDIRQGGELRLMLAIPSAATIVARTCGANAARDSTGLLIGHLRSAAGGRAMAGHVQVRWNELTVGRSGIQRATPTLDMEAEIDGAFAFCGIPLGGAVLARAWAGADSSGYVELDVPSTGLVQRDLLIGSASATAVAVVDSTLADAAQRDSVTRPERAAAATVTVYRGSGRLRGVVQRPDGRPVRGARLVLWGSGVEGTTNDNGVFALRDLPTGTWTLEARALGLFPVRLPVDVHADSEVVATVRMDDIKTILDTVKVVAQRIYLSRGMQEFESRRKAGFGYFVDQDRIERMNPMFVADLFRMAPGVSVLPSSGFGYSVVMRSPSMGGGGYCVPAFFIDGIRMMVDQGNLDAFVNALDIVGVEVYTRASNVPPQFNTMEGCGSIVIHTGQRSRTGRR